MPSLVGPMNGEPPEPTELQRNLLFRALTGAEALPSPLRRVRLSTGQLLFRQPHDAHAVYFPLDSVISMAVCFRDGTWVEVLSVGREGAIGPFNRESLPSGHDILVTVGGEAMVA